VHSCVYGLAEETPSRHSLFMTLTVVDELLTLYKRVGPLSDIWFFACERRRVGIMGPDRWDAVDGTR